VSTNIAVASSGFNDVISVVCWSPGAAIGVTALFKIKAHVDNPGHTGLTEGLIRLAIGRALPAFPFVEQVLRGSLPQAQLAKLNASTLVMDSSVVMP
jgi:hypothetical protein